MASGDYQQLMGEDVPPVDYSRIARWYTAVRDETGLRRGLLAIDQQMRRTDRIVEAMTVAAAHKAAKLSSEKGPAESLLDRFGAMLERWLIRMPSPY